MPDETEKNAYTASPVSAYAYNSLC